MSVIVDLLESAVWLETQHWPSWLTADWIAEHDAKLICRLSDPDDLTKLRAIVPCTPSLIAYPTYPALGASLTAEDLEIVKGVFVQCLGSDHYLQLTPDSQSPPKLTQLPQNDPPKRSQKTRKTLALVSPIPPTPSGISVYCAALLPVLKKSYDLTLVVSDPEKVDPAIAQKYETISHQQMMHEGGKFDRVMYHFGNSVLHYDYFILQKCHPGIVVLHDTYLGDCIYGNHAQFGDNELLQQIYASHGWAALPDSTTSVKQAIDLYPASAATFTDSYGVIVHSEYAKEILSQYFNANLLSRLSLVPLASKLKTLTDRTTARQSLGIPEGITLFSTFGMVNLNKCIIELMDAWMASGLANDPSVRLCFVGGGDYNGEIQRKIAAWISKLPDPSQVTQTGYLEPAEYDLYLSGSDVAIQLRSSSRGESSAALLDCMGSGLPTIINAHGSMSEVPSDTVIKLNDDFSIQELADHLYSTASDPLARLAVGENARIFVAENHSPSAVVEAYVEHMETQYASSPSLLIDQLHKQLLGSKTRALPAHAIYNCSDALDDLMRCANVERAVLAGSQLLIDVTGFLQPENRGMRDEAENILLNHLHDQGTHYRVEPVYYDSGAERFRYARTFTIELMGLPALQMSDDPVEAAPGDIFVSLGFCLKVATQKQSRKWLQFWRGRGVNIGHLVFDAPPLSSTVGLNEKNTNTFQEWLSTVSLISDRMITTSKSSSDAYRLWLEQQKIDISLRPTVQHVNSEPDQCHQRLSDSLDDSIGSSCQ